MGELIVSLAGTEAGGALALALALLSALAHAIFGAINKGGADPYLNRGAINLWYGAMAAPFALFVLPMPRAEVWWALGASFLIHILYEFLQARSFAKGAFTLVYPIARGTGPLAALVLAVFVFDERFSAWQWAGGLLLSAAIMGLAAVNLRRVDLSLTSVVQLRSAILTALMAGVMIAVYTTVDAYGIRLAENPFTFLVWFFTMGAFGFPFVALWRWRHMEPAQRPPLDQLALRGFFGAIIAFISFGSLMLATRVGSVGEAAALRETSIIFATAIGVLIFHEKIDPARLGLIGLIAAGAVLVEVG